MLRGESMQNSCLQYIHHKVSAQSVPDAVWIISCGMRSLSETCCMYICCHFVKLHIISSSASHHYFNQPLTHKPLNLLRHLHTITSNPSISTLYYHLHAPQHGSHKPGRLDGWLWRAAIITSVYLISVLLSEPLSVPLSPLFFSPRTRSLTPLGRSALLGKPLWTQQKDTTKTESRTAHVRTDNRHTCVEACHSSQRIWDVLTEQTQACLVFEVAVSRFERLKDFFFFAVKMILKEDKHEC